MKLKIGDRVRVLNVRPGGWAGDGAGTIRHYDPSRDYFPAGTPGAKDTPPKGPAIMVILDGPEANKEKEKLELWVTPSPAFIEIISEAA